MSEQQTETTTLNDLTKIVVVTPGKQDDPGTVDVHVVTKADAEEIRAFAAAKRIL